MKEQFINKIKELLFAKGFREIDNKFVRTVNIRQPGQVMIINGQRMEQPGQESEIKYVVTYAGDGYISNMDDSNKVDVSSVMFEVYVDGEQQGGYMEAYRWDDIEGFTQVLTNIVRQ